jgi:hypothetical protein
LLSLNSGAQHFPLRYQLTRGMDLRCKVEDEY